MEVVKSTITPKAKKTSSDGERSLNYAKNVIITILWCSNDFAYSLHNARWIISIQAFHAKNLVTLLLLEVYFKAFGIFWNSCRNTMIYSRFILLSSKNKT